MKNFFIEQLNVDPNKDEARYGDVFNNITGENLAIFLHEMGFTYAEAVSLLVDTLAYSKNNRDKSIFFN